MGYAIRVTPGKKVDLGAIETRQDGGLTKDEGKARLAPLTVELAGLLELLYAAGEQALLVILQGMDTSGKDGTIRDVFDEVSPTSTEVIGFKTPSAEELAHDFLWRVHRQVPPRGITTIFNRSHYEDVLIVRVKELVPKSVWSKRYDQINEFEQFLTENNTLVAKFFLHISKEEQEARLRAREEDVTKFWKLAVSDWEERNYWDAYQEAYTDALTKCSTAAAPWYVVPADRKWFRSLAVAEQLVDLLRPYKQAWIAALEAQGRAELAKIRALRGENDSQKS